MACELIPGAAGPTLPARMFVLGLERLGWTATSVEVDLVRETARIELRRGDLAVTFDARNGRASTTRERIEAETEVVGRKGDRCPVQRLRTRFIGRQRHEGARSGLRWLADYVADNATRPALPGEVRDLFRLLADGGVHRLEPKEGGRG